MSRQSGNVGAPKGNRNARKHGAYLQHWDGRTREVKAKLQIEAELTSALGGEPSPQQVLLIQRAAVKALRCALVEIEILRLRGQIPDSLAQDYLRWARELRADLVALGLKRIPKNLSDLKSYVESTYGE
jgi:hypothetical protein